MTQYQSDIAKAKGTGSAHEGVTHWYTQRVTAVALIPLSLWFVYSFAIRFDFEYVSLLQWINEPCVLTLSILFVSIMFYHAYLGLQVVTEDYVHGRALRHTILIALQLSMLFFAVLTIVYILQISMLGFQISV